MLQDSDNQASGSQDASTNQSMRMTAYRAVFEHHPSPISITRIQPDGRRVYVQVNQAFIRTFGYSESQVLGRTSEELGFFQDNPALAAALVEQLHTHGSIHNVEFRIATRDGSLIDGLLSGVKINDATGEWFITTMVDVSRLKALEAFLDRERRMFLRGPAMVFEWAPIEGWPVTYVSANVRDVLGWQPGQLMVGTPPYAELVHPEDLPRVAGEVASAIDTHAEVVEHKPYRLRHRSGQYRWVQDWTTVFRHADGSVDRYAGYLLDITESYEDRRQLDEQRLRLESVLAGTQAGIWEWEIATGDLMINEQWAQLLGYHAVELMPASIQTWEHLTHPEDRGRAFRQIQEHLADHEPAFSCEIRMRHKCGQWVWVLVRGMAMAWDDQGYPVRMCGTHIDITRQKRSEQALAEEQFRMTSIIQGTQLGTWEWHVQTGEVVFNDTWAQMLGYQLHELAPLSIRTWHDLAHPEDLEQSNRLLQAHFAGQSAYYECRTRMQHKQGHWIWVHDRGKVVSWDSDGRPLLMFGTHTEITDRVKAEDALKDLNRQLEDTIGHAQAMAHQAEVANNAKSAFLANMSHEIRTPMTAILGYSELLEDEKDLSEQGRRSLQTIRRNGEHLLLLINDILDIAKIDAGKMSIEQVSMNLPGLIDDVLMTLKPQADKKQIHLACEYAQDVPLLVESDPVRLRQVLMNLVGNAIKFTAEGGVRVIVHHCRRQLLRDCLTIEIADTGIGMSEEQIERVAMPFEQADFTTTRRYGGTGLGLSLSRSLVELLGGKLEIRSMVDEGTTVTICFQTQAMVQQVHDRHEQTKVRQSLETYQQSLAGTNILLVEDCADNIRLLAHHLQKAEAQVTCAEDGVEAVEAWQQVLASNQRPFDIVLMDIQMPRMDGHAAIQALRSLHYTGPVVALTAHAMYEHRLEYIESGFDAHIAKPVTRARLISKIKQLLAKRN